jgi:hypothetical protein
MIVIVPWVALNGGLHVLRATMSVPQFDGTRAEIVIFRAFAREGSYDVQTSDQCVLARGHAETLKEAKIEALIQLRTLVGAMLEQLCESARLNP